MELKVEKKQSKNHYEQLFLEKTGKDFNIFYNKYYTKLVWIIQRMNITPLDAEDIANQAFIQALNKIDQYNPKYHFSTWLFDIGKKYAYQYKNKQAKREILVDTTIDNEDNNNSYDMVQNYLRNKIDDSQIENDTHNITTLKYVETLKQISKLGDKYKEIIELCDIQGKSYNEICEILNIKLQTVKNRLHHGRLKIENDVKHKFEHIECNY